MSDDETWQLATGYKTPDEANEALVTQATAIRNLKDALNRARQPHAIDCPRAITGVPVCSCGLLDLLKRFP